MDIANVKGGSNPALAQVMIDAKIPGVLVHFHEHHVNIARIGIMMNVTMNVSVTVIETLIVSLGIEIVFVITPVCVVKHEGIILEIDLLVMTNSYRLIALWKIGLAETDKVKGVLVLLVVNIVKVGVLNVMGGV